MADRLALGVDVGGTKVAAALVDERGAVLASDRGPVAPESNDASLESIYNVVDRLLAAHSELRGRLMGIGAGAPGAVDWRTGVVAGAANLAWRNLPLAESLSKRYEVPALADNDVNVAAWGERCFGFTKHGRGSAPKPGKSTETALITSSRRSTEAESGTAPVPIQHLAYITVGTGIGAGLIESGRIVRGRRGAGEVGHIPLLENGPRCRCGAVGCLEAVAAGPAFAAAGRAAAAAGEAPGLLALAGGNPAAVTAPLVFQAAAQGDAGARRVLDREGYYLALAVTIVRRMLDPEVVVIGGGLAEAGPPLFEALWDNLTRLQPAGRSGFDPRTFAVPSSLGAEAGAIGAAALVLRPEPGFVAAGLVSAG